MAELRGGVAGVVLAAGEGVRFEGPVHKLRADFRGRPLVRWAADAAVEASLAEVYVVLGAEDLNDLLPPEVTIVVNHEWRRGQAWSLQAGVRAAEHDGHAAVVVSLADQPLVGAEAWRRVAEAPGTSSQPSSAPAGDPRSSSTPPCGRCCRSTATRAPGT